MLPDSLPAGYTGAISAVARLAAASFDWKYSLPVSYRDLSDVLEADILKMEADAEALNYRAELPVIPKVLNAAKL